METMARHINGTLAVQAGDLEQGLRELEKVKVALWVKASPRSVELVGRLLRERFDQGAPDQARQCLVAAMEFGFPEMAAEMVADMET